MSLGGGEVALLAGAGFAAGAINAAAGGGSLITFPALLAVGYPALDANVTSTVALCPGYLGGVIGYRAELAGQRGRATALGLAIAAGSVGGAGLLAISSREVFRAVVPVLVLAGSALLALQPVLARRFGPADADRAREPGAAGAPAGAAHGPPGGSLGSTAAAARRQSPALLLAVALAGAYGAYFGAALGVILLAVLGTLLRDGLQRLNALKGLLSLIANWLAAVFFVALAPVHWGAVAAVAPASLLGGRAGVALARRLSEPVLRGAVVAFGLAVGSYLLVAA